jgi:hypothetical protein
MFLLRSAFWLGVVYSTMTWTNVPLATRSGSLASAKSDELVTRLGEFCLHHAASCARDADLVTSLLTTTGPLHQNAPNDRAIPGSRAARTEAAKPAADQRRRHADRLRTAYKTVDSD